MKEAVENSRCVIAIISGEDPSDKNAYFNRDFCLKELRWAKQADTLVQPTVAAENKDRISAMMQLVPVDLQHLKGVNWEHIDRKDSDYFELGVTKIIRAAGLEPEPEPVDDCLRRIHSADGVGSGGARRASERTIFGSSRCIDGRPLAEALQLQAALEPRGVHLKIMNIRSWQDISEEVFRWIEKADTFLAFGTKDYAEDTGNPASTYHEAKFAQGQRKRIVLLRMIPWEDSFEHLQARVMFGQNQLELPWLPGNPIPAGLVDGIVAALELDNGATSAPTSEPTQKTGSLPPAEITTELASGHMQEPEPEPEPQLTQTLELEPEPEPEPEPDWETMCRPFQDAGHADKEVGVGVRLRIHGDDGQSREGTYVGFHRSWVGANVHVIRFDDSGAEEELKLKHMKHLWKAIGGVRHSTFKFSGTEYKYADEQYSMGGGGVFDQCGILHHIATETGSWVNPHLAGEVVVQWSSVRYPEKIKRVPDTEKACEYIVSGADEKVERCCSTSSPNSWVSLDLSAARRLAVNHYAVRTDKGSAVGEFRFLRNWELQASNDEKEWTRLRRHENDESLELVPYAVADWPVEANSKGPFRYFRILQFGKNADGGKMGDRWHCLACSGIELYGELTCPCA